MAIDATTHSYRAHADEAIRNWVKGRRRRRVPPFLRRMIKTYCRPRLIGRMPMHVLDAGCGPGLDSIEFARAGCDVVGVDIVPEFIRHARRLSIPAPTLGILNFMYGDLRCELVAKLKNKRFDLIWANASLIHFRKRELPRVLRRLAPLLAPGGMFAATFFHGKGEGVYHGSFVPGRFFARYLKEEIRRAFQKSGWNVREIRTVTNEDRRGRWLNVEAVQEIL